MSNRTAMLEEIADHVAALARSTVRRVAIDGVDGAGKTVFADGLADSLRSRGESVVRASVDGFHHPRAVRYRRGRSSPDGFFRDSYDYAALRRRLLDPLSPGGTLRYVTSVHDVDTDEPVDRPEAIAPVDAVLVFDGIFLHRPELAGYWDLSVFLDVPFEVSIPRGAQRGYGDPDPGAPSNRRYVGGQQLYIAECQPRRQATIVVDNRDLSRPVVVRRTPDGG